MFGSEGERRARERIPTCRIPTRPLLTHFLRTCLFGRSVWVIPLKVWISIESPLTWLRLGRLGNICSIICASAHIVWLHFSGDHLGNLRILYRFWVSDLLMIVIYPSGVTPLGWHVHLKMETTFLVVGPFVKFTGCTEYEVQKGADSRLGLGACVAPGCLLCRWCVRWINQSR